MNLLLLEPGDFISANQVRISGRRLRHMLDIQHAKPGDSLKAGLLNSQMGTATLLSLSANSAELEISLTTTPLLPLPVTIILALPRPKMLRRILQTIATMGVKQLYLVNSWRVEKSYWQSPWLSPSAIREQLILGLEQGGDTLLPEVHLEPLFKPFVEDKLPAITTNSVALVAHPYGNTTCPTAIEGAATLAIGPEGGFIDYEIQKLQEAGFAPVTLGKRILRVETAIPAILGRMFH